MTAPETIIMTCQYGAHHEPGHTVIAAVEGLPLKPEGLMVDPSGWGLACYHDAPGDTDSARERNILAELAGFGVEKAVSAAAALPTQGIHGDYAQQG